MKFLGIDLDAYVHSTLTKMLWLALVAWGAWHFFRAKLSTAFWVGYGVASLVMLWLMTTKTNPVDGDKVFEVSDGDGGTRPGTLNEAAQRGAERRGVVGGQVNKQIFW